MPNELVYHDEISSSAKVFFVCVSSHTAEKGYSFASNDYFAKKMNVSVRQIQRWLEELAAYLYVFEENGKRRIMLYPGDMEYRTRGGVTKMSWGGDKNVTHNNINIINKKNIIKKEPPKNDSEKDYESMFGDLVEALGYNRKTTRFTPARRTKLLTRLKTFTFGEIVNAAKIIKDDPFMQGENDRKTKYGDIDYLLRNDEKLEHWVNKAPKVDPRTFGEMK